MQDELDPLKKMFHFHCDQVLYLYSRAPGTGTKRKLVVGHDGEGNVMVLFEGDYRKEGWAIKQLLESMNADN